MLIVKCIFNMEKTILISPFSRKLNNGNKNAKNYPFWQDVINGVVNKGYKVIQLGVSGEYIFDNVTPAINLPLSKIEDLIGECFAWVSVDNFLPHLANIIHKKGVVIFSVSDPNIFGYKQNVNLLKDRRYLREHQFLNWECAEYKEESFIDYQDVLKALELNFGL